MRPEIQKKAVRRWPRGLVTAMAVALVGLGLGVGLGPATGCSVLVSPEAQQCATDADCVNRGGAFAGTTCQRNVCVAPDGGASAAKWECLGMVTQAIPTKSMITLTMPVEDLLTHMAPTTGISARACAKQDVACANPLVANVTPNAEGRLLFTLGAGFNGYVEIVSTTTPPTYVPGLVFFNPPLNDDYTSIRVRLIAPETLPLLAGAAGAELDLTKGLLVFIAQDCDGVVADGVGANLDDYNGPPPLPIKRFYFKNDLPFPDATATDPSGIGGFINLTSGVHSITATHQASGKPLGTISALVRPSSISYAALPPQPAGAAVPP